MRANQGYPWTAQTPGISHREREPLHVSKPATVRILPWPMAPANPSVKQLWMPSLPRKGEIDWPTPKSSTCLGRTAATRRSIIGYAICIPRCMQPHGSRAPLPELNSYASAAFQKPAEIHEAMALSTLPPRARVFLRHDDANPDSDIPNRQRSVRLTIPSFQSMEGHLYLGRR